jgi:hypothetical protein
MEDEIIPMPELIGRVITNAATDGETMSIALDNGGILQIRYDEYRRRLSYEVEFSTETEG